MAKREGFKAFFSQGQKRSYRFAPDDFNPFAGLGEDIENFAEKWKKGKVNIFLAFGDIGIDIEALKKAYPGAAAPLSGIKARTRHMAAVIKLRDALKGIEDLLNTKDPKTRKKLQKIAKQAYLNVVPKALDAYLTAKEARHIISVGGAKESTAKIRFKKTFWQVSGRGQYSKLWEKVVDIILDGAGKGGKTKYLRDTPTGVSSFTIKDLMDIEISRSKSKYRSVFMMEEFGTGQGADPTQRVYQSKGTTFFKVPPYLISAVSGRIGKIQLRSATAAWFVTRGALAYAEGQFALYQKLRSKKGKKGLADQALKNLSRVIENWTYGYKEGRHKGRTALHLFFEKGRIAKTIRDIQLKAQEEFVKVLNQEIKKFAPEFPGLRAVLVSRG